MAKELRIYVVEVKLGLLRSQKWRLQPNPLNSGQQETNKSSVKSSVQKSGILTKDSHLEIIDLFQQSVYMSILTSFSKIHCQEETIYALISIQRHSDCVMCKQYLSRSVK